MQIGDKLKLKIEKLVLGGEGLGHIQGRVVFVPYSCPGDEVFIEINEIKSNYARGIILEIVEASPQRESPPCAYFFQPPKKFFCGGCNWQHIRYPAQLEYKNKLLQEALKQLASLDLAKIKINPPLPSPEIWRYRNKMQVPLGKQGDRIIAGFYAPQTHQIVDFQDCLLHSHLLNDILQYFKKILESSGVSIYNEDTGSGLLRHIILRQSFVGDKVQLILVSRNKNVSPLKPMIQKLLAKFNQIQSVFMNINPAMTNVILGKETIKIYGKDYLTERIGKMDYFISPESFFQINKWQTENLYNLVANFARGKEAVLWDLYCGCGTIGLYCASLVKQVYGVEEKKSAVSDAWNNARRNKINNAHFFQGKAEKIIAQLFREKYSDRYPGIVIFDPPRAGCSPSVLETVARASPERIIYISCEPSTLARDIKFLVSRKYCVKEIQAVDMFPQTAHIEAVAVLELKTSVSD